MGTSSAIGVKQADGGVMAVTCHWDGYHERVGRILHKFYGGEAKAMQLLSLGSLSSLGESMTPPPGVRHSLEHPTKGVTVAFHRDGGDDLHKPVQFKDAEDYRMNAQSRFVADYVYLLENGVWNVLVNQSWIPARVTYLPTPISPTPVECLLTEDSSRQEQGKSPFVDVELAFYLHNEKVITR